MAKKRDKKYEQKLAVGDSFAQVFKVVKKNKEDKLAQKTKKQSKPK